MGSKSPLPPTGVWLHILQPERWLILPVVFALAMLGMLPAAGMAVLCTQPDNGTGTVNLPPEGCEYLSPQQVHMIIDGLPPGTTIELDPIHAEFINATRYPGGILGGEVEEFESYLFLHATGTGMLAGFDRDLTIPIVCEVHTGPRNPGDSVQTFPNEMFRLQGAIYGDPDFDLLRFTAGTGFGMPSPGQTTLTKLPDGTFNVESFFDITYRLDFVGAPGGMLAGMSGSTTATLRMNTGQEPPPIGACCFPDGNCIETFEAGCPTGDWRPGEGCDPNPCPQPPNDCVEPDNGTGTINLPPEDCQYLSPDDVHLIIDGLPPGTTIELDPIHDRFMNTTRYPGGTLGGEVEIFDSRLHLDLRGTGQLEGFMRTLDVWIGCEVHTGPRTPGDPVQTFPNDMFRLQGSIYGDPDFDLLRFTAGTDFGMPSPGQTTLTQLPGGPFNVDSFFDITYRIDFVGAPGGVLAGMSGSTTGTLPMETGETIPPPTGACCYPNGGCIVTHFPDCPTGDFRLYEVCDPNPCPQPAAVDEEQPVMHGRLEAHPNPFYSTTTIFFTLDAPGLAELQIFDVAGRMVRRLAESNLAAGPHRVVWDGHDGAGNALKSGVYFYQLRVDGRLVGSKRVLLLK